MPDPKTIAQETPKLKKVYEYLKKNNKVRSSTYEEFESKMQQPGKLEKVYEALKSEQKVRSEDFNTFKQSMFPEDTVRKEQPMGFIPEDNAPPAVEPQPVIQEASPAVEQEQSSPTPDSAAISPETQAAFNQFDPSTIAPSSPEDKRFEFDQQRIEDKRTREMITGEKPGKLPSQEIIDRANSFGGQFNQALVSGITSIPKAIAIGANKLDEFFGTGEPGKKVEEYATYKVGEGIDKKMLDWGITTTNPDHDDSFWNSTIPSALGSVASMAIFGRPNPTSAALATEKSAITKGLTEAGKSLRSPGAVVGGTSMAVPEFEAAKASGMSDEDAFGVFLKNYAVGQTEIIPFQRALSRINKLSGGGLMQTLKVGAVGGLEEGTQETVQGILTNKIAQGSYDPERDTFTDVIDQAGAGFFVGMILPGIGRAMNSMTPEQKVQTKQVINDKLMDVKNGIPERDKNVPEQQQPEVEESISGGPVEQEANTKNVEAQQPEVPVTPSPDSTEVVQGERASETIPVEETFQAPEDTPQSREGSVAETPKIKTDEKGRKSKGRKKGLLKPEPTEEAVAEAAAVSTPESVQENDRPPEETVDVQRQADDSGLQQSSEDTLDSQEAPAQIEETTPVVQESDENVPKEEFGYKPGAVKSGTEVKFEWLGLEKTGKVVGYNDRGDRIKIKGKDGTVYPINPEKVDVKIVSKEEQMARPISEERPVAYNSRRKQPIGIVSNGLPGENSFMFQTDLGKKISDTFQKQFTSKGFLPKAVFDRWIKTKGEIGKYESQVKFTLSDTKRAIKQEYKGKPTDAQITDINLALQGKTPSNPLPPKTAVAVQEMRAQIDNLSRRFINEGIVSGDLSLKFQKNLGTYLTRSYRKFDDPFWAEFVPDQVRTNAEGFLRGKYPKYSNEEIQGLINYIMYDPQAPGALLKGSKLGSKDLSLLKKREQIAPEIRALMGEYGDPLLNYTRTITKMANLVAKHHFLQDVKAQGIGVFLFDKPTGKYSVPIAAEGSKTMAPLNGLYTTQEIGETFEQFNSMEPMPDWVKWYMKANAWVKAGKTVFSVMTHARNLMGNIGFVVMNGHYRVDKAGSAIQNAWANVYADDKAIRDKFQEYIQLGVVQDSGAAGELKNYIEDIRKGKDFFEKINDNKIRKIKNGILDTTQNLYQFEDDLFKIYAFENEFERYKKAFPAMPVDQLKDKAANIVRDTYPTYSMVPKIVKSLRANPLLGTFVSFPAEVLRTTYNTIALAKEELSNPSTRSIGAQRAAGIMMASLMPTAASYATRALLGLDGEDDEDLRRFVAPWQKNSEYLYMGVDGDKYRIIDMGYSDPHSYLKRPIYDLLKGDDLTKSAVSAVGSLAQPFLSEELLAERLIDLSRNRKKTGDHVYNPDAPVGDQVEDMWHHMQVAIEPGTAASLRRIIKAGGGETDKYGNKYELQNELIGLVSGQKQEVKDISQALLFRAYELKDRVDLTEKELFRVTKNKTSTEEDVAKAKSKHDSAMELISEEALKIYLGAIRLGVDPKEARKTMMRTRSPIIIKKIKQ
jgi:hypothetical protein